MAGEELRRFDEASKGVARPLGRRDRTHSGIAPESIQLAR